MDLEFHREQLGGGISVYTAAPHTFNEDSLLLAAFSRAERAERACDFGAGCGIIPLMWCRGEQPESITAVDLSDRACALARYGVAQSGLTDRIEVICADIRDFWRTVRVRYDLVTMNPPYYRAGSGRRNQNGEKALARQDGAAEIGEVCVCAARVLRQGGRLCICFPAERLCDALCAMRSSHIEPKRLRPVSSRPGQAARLYLLEGVLGGRPGMRIEPELISCDNSGTRTAQMEEFLNGGVL